MANAPVDEEERDDGPQTRLIDFKGHRILIKKLVDGQFVQMNHEVNVMTSNNADTDRKMKAMDRVHRIMLSVVLNPEDKETIEELMADGEIQLKDLADFVSAFKDEEEDQPKPKVVRRGRPVRRN
jgi:hypothetical protein